MNFEILNEFSEKFDELVNKFRIDDLKKRDIAAYIDHTLLKPEATEKAIKNLCREAIDYKFKSVCVNPYYVKLSANELKGTDIEIASVVGFPLGATPYQNKVDEAKRAVDDGATEIDMVINIGALKDKKYDLIKKEIKGVVSVGVVTKVIIETCLLDDEEKVIATRLVMETGADFVKTSTGFNKGGATIRDVALLKFVAGDKLKVKAAGGIRDFETASAMIFAGAERIGASRSVTIVSEE